MTDGQFLVRLAVGGPTDAAVLGGKGASLARLVDRRLPVPTTAVITTAAYRAAVAGPELAEFLRHVKDAPPDSAVPAVEVDRAFSAATIPSAVEDAIARYVEQDGAEAARAVRSSATAEDLQSVSFAGQYRSSLGIVGVDETRRAVRSTWASLWYPAAIAYRRAWGIDDVTIAMAAVVMGMVDARVAGVVFTVDPSGDPSSCHVEAVPGLADALVSGASTPSIWLIPRDAAPPAAAPEEVCEAARLALAIEADEGVAQDVEWAWDGDVVWIVQARPITTATRDEFDTPIDDHELTTEGIAEMVPGVLAPFLWDVNSFLVEEAFRQTLGDIAAMPGDASQDDRLLRRVHGRAALDLDRLRASASLLGVGAVSELERGYFADDRSTSRPPSSPRHGRDVVRGLRVVRARRRALDDAEIIAAAVELLQDDEAPLVDRDDRLLVALLRRHVDLGARIMATELAVAAVAAAAFRRLEAELGRTLSPPEATAAARSMTTSPKGPEAPSPRASRSIFGGATWGERRTRATGDGTTSRSAEHSLDLPRELRAVRANRRSMPGAVVDAGEHRVRRLADDAVHALETREELKRGLFLVGGEVRRVHRELAHRLVVRGVLRDVEEAELLTLAELARTLVSGRCARALLERRRRELRRAVACPSLPVRFRGTPPAAVPPPTAPGQPTQLRLEGWPASAGSHRGVGRVLRGADDLDALAPGEVLVAETTDASWLPLFLRAGAIVVERGGPLSHAAIVARELAVPAVLNIENATSLLDGRLLDVDGDRGTVELVDGARIAERT